jgi:hypothetical protein
MEPIESKLQNIMPGRTVSITDVQENVKKVRFNGNEKI